jgi:hypothetical protein
VRETTEGSPWDGDLGDALALRFDASRRVMLRFELALQGSENLEALRYARRSMIREERTRGLEWDEPSMEDPTFSDREIRWFALASQVAWCRLKVAELIERANRAATALGDRRTPGDS